MTQPKAFFNQVISGWVLNIASNIEQVGEATLQKAPTIRPPTSHQENYPS